MYVATELDMKFWGSERIKSKEIGCTCDDKENHKNVKRWTTVMLSYESCCSITNFQRNWTDFVRITESVRFASEVDLDE